MPAEEMGAGADMPAGDEMAADMPAEEPTGDMPFEKEPFDAGVEADEDTDPKKFIEQLSGKLGQSLRQYTKDQGQPDFELEKFAINSVISATNSSQMDEEDKDDIIKKLNTAGKDDAEDSMGDAEGGADLGDDSLGGPDVGADNPDELGVPSDEEPVQEGGFMLDKTKKLSIFAPEGSEEAKFKHLSEMREDSNNYMFWQNLKTIVHAASELLEMDCNKVDDLLSDGHGWALDHIATSADDVAEVYHFVDNNLNDWHADSEEEMDYSKWSEPMKLVQPVAVSKDLGYHLNNNIALGESIFRYGSEKFKTLLKEVKQLQQKGLIKLNENDQFIVDDYDNGFVVVNENRVKLNTIFEEIETGTINEAEFQGKKVELGKPKRGGSKKFYVYVRNPKTGKVKKVSFGAKAGGGNLAVKLKDPKARKAFSDRHNCKSKNDKTKPGYWACRLPRYAKLLGLSGGGTWW
jgi:hypothetical protein